MAQADAELRTMGREFAATHPADRGWTLYAIPLRQQLLSRTAAAGAAVMMGAVSFVLLIACANVANLLLARGAGRTRELAVRTALGAGRGRIVRQLLGESLVLSLAGGVLGLLIARGGVAWITRQSTDMASWIVFDIDWRVLAFAAAASVATAVAVGLVPALRATGAMLTPVLRDGGRGASAGTGGRRLRNGLVVGELALSLVLLAGAGLMVKSFLHLQHADPGFDPAGLTVAQVYTGGTRYDSPAARTQFAAAVLERVRALPGVTAAAITNAAPLDGSSTSSGYVVEGQPAAPGEEKSTEWRGVTADYRRTMAIPLLAGRDFAAAEAHDTATRTVLVNDILAARAWPGESPLGRHVSFRGGEAGSWYTIVGVVGTVQQRMNRNRAIGAQVYFAHADAPRRGSSVIVRGGDPTTLAALVRRAVREVDAGVPVVQTRPYAAIVSRSLMEQRIFGALFGVFAAVALALAVIGVYGVIAYTVAMRTRELGVRIALGASIRDVYALLLRQGGTLVLAGLAIGTVAALGLTRLLGSALHGVSTTDPAVFASVVAALALPALVATWVPARRAARVDPAITLRGE
jgi:putative ABC transport system permease protein